MNLYLLAIFQQPPHVQHQLQDISTSMMLSWRVVTSKIVISILKDLPS
jgi:hypothetical protein